MEHNDRLGLRYEIARKAIHLSSLAIALIYCHIERELALTLLVPLFLGFFSVDLLKNFRGPVADWYHGTFGSMLREHELEGERIHMNGATCITLSALLLVLLFPKIIAITAFSMVAVSDTMAALVGKTFGRHRFGHKSLEGSGAFFLSALAIVAVVPNIDPMAGVTMAVTGTLAEAFVFRIAGFRIDDNLTIPLTAAAAGMLYYLLFIPDALRLLSICR
ncbi:diacylglycerol/polyprenol kinase family protein [Chlorobium sp. N1]|uniref:diacylglycerol/polyprenol kinase family protein n=1 Tax=Chlorobium sp. N1 TaxID=2491138 RepID=UPI00103BE762|nr:diacylglycerol/polyprenol kinase family protein [Chlorobium sp. N1]TCD48808.1 phosphatidate cytidylyltransferase [Chlorobium sp. N1]